jgi:Ala-tRNA(Pro) deacylase
LQVPINTLKAFLDDNDVKYVTIRHSIAYTAHDTAQSAHVPADAFAKTIIVQLGGDMAMAVLRGSDKLDLQRLRRTADADSARLAGEEEFQGLFPGVELGAMPPFGNLYDLAVYADRALACNERIAFNAGTHREVIELGWADFNRLAEPVLADIVLDEAAHERP